MLKIYLWSFIIWIVILIIALIVRKTKAGKILLIFSFSVFILFVIEMAAIVGFKVKYGYWTFKEKYNENAEIFKAHPYLVGVPKKNVSLKMRGKIYSHNSQGFRAKDFPPKSNKIRVATIGGSTTYCIGVNDKETWTYYLDSFLQKNYEVLNFGIPGHSTVENIILSSFILPEYKADIAIVYAGLNDLRNANVKNLNADYSNFHAPSLYGTLGFCPQNSHLHFASIKFLTIVLQKIGYYPLCEYHKMNVSGKETKEIDKYALSLYKRNLKNLVAILKNQNIKIIFVPQVMTQNSVEGGKYKWWAPYIPDDVFDKFLNEYNRAMTEVAKETGVICVNYILQASWTESDYSDPSHFSAKGNLRFAKALDSVIVNINMEE